MLAARSVRAFLQKNKKPTVRASCVWIHRLQSQLLKTGLSNTHFDGTWCWRNILEFLCIILFESGVFFHIFSKEVLGFCGHTRWLTSTRTFVLLVYQQLETKTDFGQHVFSKQTTRNFWHVLRILRDFCCQAKQIEELAGSEKYKDKALWSSIH